MAKVYHITSMKNAPRIMEEGLVPSCSIKPYIRGEFMEERACVSYAFPDIEQTKKWPLGGVVFELNVPEDVKVGDYGKAGEVLTIHRCVTRGASDDPLDPSFLTEMLGKCTEEALQEAILEYQESLVPLKDYRGQIEEPEVLLADVIQPKDIRMVAIKWRTPEKGKEKFEQFEGDTDALQQRIREHNEQIRKEIVPPKYLPLRRGKFGFKSPY